MKKGFILSDNIITANILELKKLKLCHCTPWKRLGERRYSSYSFSTSALDEVNGKRHAPAAL
jgi:hypothetical protein